MLDLRTTFSEALSGAPTALAAANRLCQACVTHLSVDGASISLISDGASHGTFGSSGDLSRRLDELQFTFGEGPCLDATRAGRPILAPDLDDAAELRWPAFAGALLDVGVKAIFALPVSVATLSVGALDLMRHRGGELSAQDLKGGMLAARFAALPLLDLMSGDVRDDSPHYGEDAWDQLALLERVEVYQATGMIAEALDVTPAEALVRLRAFAFARDRTAVEVAWDIVERRLLLDGPDWLHFDGTDTAS